MSRMSYHILLAYSTSAVMRFKMKIVRKLPSSTSSAAAAAARTSKTSEHHRERGVQTAVETMA
eukprot:3153466-Pleurochrysis_carterae.AAC.2